VEEKPYSVEERELAFNWCEKWLELIDLINEVTGSPEPPVDLDELQYQGLRFWLIGHQKQFIPLWKNFRECQDWSSHQSFGNEDIVDFKDAERYLENPFSYFYEPENLYQLAKQLDLQSGIDVWEPSEYRASMIRPLVIRVGEIMIEFIDWISE